MFWAQFDRHIFKDAVVDHKRAKEGRLCLYIARQALFLSIIGGGKSDRFGHGDAIE
jgi:hypothetical protein